jgi:hypothetical protein
MNVQKEGSLSALVSSYEGGLIDEEAVMVVSESDEVRVVALCRSLPADTWAFLLAIYVLLLAFNLREQGRISGEIAHWRFETFLTVFFLVEWFVFDGCREALWFPLSLIKCSLIVFLIFQVKNIFSREEKSNAFVQE